MSPVRFVLEGIRNCAVHLAANLGGIFMLPKKAKNLFKMGYASELNTSILLSNFYQDPKMDDQTMKDGTKVWFFSSHVAFSREGCLDAAVCVIAHVGQIYNSRLVYDSSYPEIDQSVFKKCNWSGFYRKAKEAIHINAPEP